MITSQQPSRAALPAKHHPRRCRPAGPGRSAAPNRAKAMVSRPVTTGVVGVAGAAAAALGEQDHRQAATARPARTAGPSCGGSAGPGSRPAPCSRRTAPRSGPRSSNWSPLTRPMPATSPSAGVLAISSSRSRRSRWAAMASDPYSVKLPGSHRSSMFSRAVRRAPRVPSVDCLRSGRRRGSGPGGPGPRPDRAASQVRRPGWQGRPPGEGRQPGQGPRRGQPPLPLLPLRRGLRRRSPIPVGLPPPPERRPPPRPAGPDPRPRPTPRIPSSSIR